MWFTAISGTPLARLSDFAYVNPTSSDPTSPGPTVAAIAASDRSSTPADSSASRTTGTIARRCSRDASSGTTPPYFPWVLIWEATTEESTRPPSSTTAAAVSSQEDSIPRIRTTHSMVTGYSISDSNDAVTGSPPLRQLYLSSPSARSAQRSAAHWISSSSGTAGWSRSSMSMESSALVRMMVSSSLRSCETDAVTEYGLSTH